MMLAWESNQSLPVPFSLQIIFPCLASWVCVVFLCFALAAQSLPDLLSLAVPISQTSPISLGICLYNDTIRTSFASSMMLAVFPSTWSLAAPKSKEVFFPSMAVSCCLLHAWQDQYSTLFYSAGGGRGGGAQGSERYFYTSQTFPSICILAFPLLLSIKGQGLCISNPSKGRRQVGELEGMRGKEGNSWKKNGEDILCGNSAWITFKGELQQVWKKAWSESFQILGERITVPTYINLSHTSHVDQLFETNIWIVIHCMYPLLLIIKTAALFICFNR